MVHVFSVYVSDVIMDQVRKKEETKTNNLKYQIIKSKFSSLIGVTVLHTSLFSVYIIFF